MIQFDEVDGEIALLLRPVRMSIIVVGDEIGLALTMPKKLPLTKRACYYHRTVNLQGKHIHSHEGDTGPG